MEADSHYERASPSNHLPLSSHHSYVNDALANCVTSPPQGEEIGRDIPVRTGERSLARTDYDYDGSSFRRGYLRNLRNSRSIFIVQRHPPVYLMEIGTARVERTMSRTVVNHVFPLFLSFLCSLIFLCANGHSATRPHGLLDSI